MAQLILENRTEQIKNPISLYSQDSLWYGIDDAGVVSIVVYLILTDME